MHSVMRDLQILLEQSKIIVERRACSTFAFFVSDFRDREDDVLGEFYG
jgi:hypothetical protein